MRLGDTEGQLTTWHRAGIGSAVQWGAGGPRGREEGIAGRWAGMGSQHWGPEGEGRG